MGKILAILVAATIAAMAGFAIHVFSAEWVSSWITTHMKGHEAAVVEAWDVRYVAAITSLETGFGITFCYLIAKKAFPDLGVLKRALLLAAILMAVMGVLVRQPLMNLISGNPLSVVIVQDGIKWVIWITVSLIVAFTYEGLTRRRHGS